MCCCPRLQRKLMVGGGRKKKKPYRRRWVQDRSLGNSAAMPALNLAKKLGRYKKKKKKKEGKTRYSTL